MFCSVLCLLCFCARLFICALWSPAGKGLTSWLSFVVSTVSLSLSHWYPGSGVVLDCIDSWSLHTYLLWSTSELRVRLAPLNRSKPSSKIFYWAFQGGTSFVDLLCFVLSYVCYVFVRVCLYALCGHLLGKGWPLGSRLWCLLWVCHFPIGILGQVWYLIVSIPDLCTLTYFDPHLN